MGGAVCEGRRPGVCTIINQNAGSVFPARNKAAGRRAIAGPPGGGDLARASLLIGGTTDLAAIRRREQDCCIAIPRLGDRMAWASVPAYRPTAITSSPEMISAIPSTRVRLSVSPRTSTPDAATMTKLIATKG
ncbi:hypothetical protein MAA5396_00984 [Marinovum algicola]|jgi:hypothetical protein|uniref:Uncharacterized protein n=1 Tax=Marinovum algicola TaxID=42444 RepID=A0A975W6T0_9RHOB|nr:hypothetical protein SAMN04487940_101473 [Marinovum algicola]SLN24941.1 hypothetical protein MAA5396_00984 [Marinovum algicola]